MTREQFKANEQYCVLTNSDLNCHGGEKPRDLQKHEAVAWLLDPHNSTAVVAVLDEDDDTVATLNKNGDIIWTDLADFGA